MTTKQDLINNLKIILPKLSKIETAKTSLTKTIKSNIADLLKNKKIEEAKTKVSLAIKEDYYLEALEILKAYLENILKFFDICCSGDPHDLYHGIPPCSINKSVSSVIWSFYHLDSDDQVELFLRKEFGSIARILES